MVFLFIISGLSRVYITFANSWGCGRKGWEKRGKREKNTSEKENFVLGLEILRTCSFSGLFFLSFLPFTVGSFWYLQLESGLHLSRVLSGKLCKNFVYFCFLSQAYPKMWWHFCFHFFFLQVILLRKLAE